jgi:flagellar secretion chaperone FliS
MPGISSKVTAMVKHKGGKVYQQLQLESQVAGASPHELISLLFSHTRAQFKAAGVANQAGRLQVRRDSLSKAIACLGGLSESLNFDVASDLPYNLQNLYLYMQQTLIANQREFSQAKIDEVSSLLETLADGWAQIKN